MKIHLQADSCKTGLVFIEGLTGQASVPQSPIFAAGTYKFLASRFCDDLGIQVDLKNCTGEPVIKKVP